MQTTEKENTKSKKSIWPTLITLSIIALLIALAISFMPRSFSTDFSIVGKGTNALVLVYDPNIIQSTQITAAMNEVRDDYAGQLEFIIVQIGTPTGLMLSNTYNIKAPVLLFFDPKGKILKILYTSQDSASLRHNFDLIFKLKESNKQAQ